MSRTEWIRHCAQFARAQGADAFFLIVDGYVPPLDRVEVAPGLQGMALAKPAPSDYRRPGTLVEVACASVDAWFKKMAVSLKPTT